MGWDIKKTLDLVEAEFGQSHRVMGNASIQFTSQRVRSAYFHYNQVLDDLAAYREEVGDRIVVAAAFGIDGEARETYPVLMDRESANP